MKNIFTSFIIFLIFLLFSYGFNIYAETYGYNQNGEAVPSQAGYIAEKSIRGQDLGISGFNNPQDIFIYQDKIYIADSGNARIISTNTDFNNTPIIYEKFKTQDGKETYLKNPTGIYADSEKIYIADDSRIIVSDFDSNILLEINIENPRKVIADKAGNIYAICENISSGAVMFDSKGNSLGFYGANRTEKPVFFENIKDIFRNDEKKLRRKRNIPPGISGFDIDSGNFIYTCTQSDKQDTDVIKKINSAGQNLFMYNSNIFGDYPLLYSSPDKNAFCDIDISPDGFINCLDFRYGKIFQYDKNCNLVFISGEKSHQLGGFERVSAIESTENSIFILDSMKNNITVFNQTYFGKLVHNAIELYNSGEYEKSLELWKNVLVCDSGYISAYAGIASVYLMQENYSESMKYAKQAELTDIYNKAFEGFRNDLLSENFGIIFFAAIFLIFLIFIIIKKLLSIKFTENIKTSVIIIMLLFFASIADGRLYGIQFRTDYIPVFNIISYFLKSIGIFLLWCISCRACGTFLDGCGTFRNIFIRHAYALIPFIAQLYINTILSHILIQDEIIFMQIIEITGITISAIKIFISIKEVHCYDIKKTVISLFMTLAGIIIMLCLLILILSLFRQIYAFILEVITEISYRIRS